MSGFRPSPRMCATTAILMFLPVVLSYVTGPGGAWLDYPGICFHLAIFLLVARLPAPEWARAAGYGWLVVDVMVGVMTLNHVPAEVAMPMRLGGHIFAGIWIVNVSLLAVRPIKLTGLVAGTWLAGYSFVSPFVPKTALAPTALLVIIWLGLIAWRNGSTPEPCSE
jgi:hypothetical protein